MWRCIVFLTGTKVSEGPTVSIFRVEGDRSVVQSSKSLVTTVFNTTRGLIQKASNSLFKILFMKAVGSSDDIYPGRERNKERGVFNEAVSCQDYITSIANKG